MTKHSLENLRPTPWLTLIPLWVISSVVMLLLGAVAIAVTFTLGPKYHMNWLGEPSISVEHEPLASHGIHGPSQQS